MSARTDDPLGLEAERLAARAAAALARPGAWLEAAAGAYSVRQGPDRRRRPAISFGEAAFAVLAREPGLKPRPAGGWSLAAPPKARVAEGLAARPGVLLGEKTVMEADGRLATRAANLGESPVAWLARRRDSQGRPWLSPVQVAAAERLREDFARAGMIGRMTMSWDAGPKAKGGRGPGAEPAEQARAAKDRLGRALDAMGPGLKEIVEQVCLKDSAIDAAERALDLPRRAAKTLLRLALDRLAAHYRMG